MIKSNSTLRKPERDSHRREHSTPSTTSAAEEGAEALPKKPSYDWQMDAGLDNNFSRLGKLLISLGLPLYEHPDGGLILAQDGAKSAQEILCCRRSSF